LRARVYFYELRRGDQIITTGHLNHDQPLGVRESEAVESYLALPSGPGLGVTLKEAVVAEHPRSRVHFDLFSERSHHRHARTSDGLTSRVADSRSDGPDG
jgi:hypothetical protein